MTVTDIVAELRRLYHCSFDSGLDEHIDVEALPQGGGDRKYFRLKGKAGECIGAYDPDPCEARCFVNLARNLHEAGCNVPAIISCSDDDRLYLQEDLGDFTLFSLIGKDDEIDSKIKDALCSLIKLQKTPRSVWEQLCMSSAFNKRQIMWDLNYFKYDFLKFSGIEFNESLLEDDFDLMCHNLLNIRSDFWGFMMRDCQSRNVMVTDAGLKFIDFQGGRLGPSLYDAVSFLWQARAGFSQEFRAAMTEYYVNMYCEGAEDKKQEMLSSLPDLVLFRTLQVLGAYGFRGLFQRRAHFIVSISGALENLKQLILQGALEDYPELKRVSQALADSPKFISKDVGKKLKVEIFSFSYKNGYPDDMSGNGGGFMFDCRAMHNPGRYKEYRSLTGRSKPVIEFLEQRGEVQNFLKSAWSLTDPAVERYLSRGFSKLQIGFGCTGGQHRSVYCAEKTACHVTEMFPEVEVVLVHREHPE